MNLKSKIALASLTFIASGAALAQAKAPEPDYTLAYNIGAVSDYRFRGITQTNYGAAVQGGVDFTHKSGIYLGVWASNVNWVKQVNGASKGDYEVDLYGGYRGEIKPGLSYDVGFITYQYPGNDSGQASSQLGAGAYSNASTNEFYGAITYGITTLKYNQSMGDFLGNINTNASRYWDLSANFDLTNGYNLVPHVGRQTLPSGAGVPLDNASYNDFALTLGKDFGNGITASLAYYYTTADQTFYVNQGAPIGDGKMIGKSGAALGVKYTF